MGEEGPRPEMQRRSVDVDQRYGADTVQFGAPTRSLPRPVVYLTVVALALGATLAWWATRDPRPPAPSPRPVVSGPLVDATPRAIAVATLDHLGVRPRDEVRGSAGYGHDGLVYASVTVVSADGSSTTIRTSVTPTLPSTSVAALCDASFSSPCDVRRLDDGSRVVTAFQDSSVLVSSVYADQVVTAQEVDTHLAVPAVDDGAGHPLGTDGLRAIATDPLIGLRTTAGLVARGARLRGFTGSGLGPISRPETSLMDLVGRRVRATPEALAFGVARALPDGATDVVNIHGRADRKGRYVETYLLFRLAGQDIELSVEARSNAWAGDVVGACRQQTVQRCRLSPLPDGQPRTVTNLGPAVTLPRGPATGLAVEVLRRHSSVKVVASVAGSVDPGDFPITLAELTAIARDPLVGLQTTQQVADLTAR